MGFDVGTVGNHELDEGGTEMLRLLRGGRRTDGPRAFTSDPGWQGARYPYLAANTIDGPPAGRFSRPTRWCDERVCAWASSA